MNSRKRAFAQGLQAIKGKAKVGIECPESEGTACQGRIKLTAGGKKTGKGKFNVPAGESKNAKVKLTKKGTKTLDNAGGSLLVSVLVTTTEPGGVSETDGRILLYR